MATTKSDIIAMLRDAGGDYATCTLARILQGVSSPGIGLACWARKPYWAKYGDVDFSVLTAAVERQRAVADAAAMPAAARAARKRARPPAAAAGEGGGGEDGGGEAEAAE